MKKRTEKSCRNIVIISSSLIAAAVLLLAAARYAGGFAEWYSVNVYSLITGTAGRFWGAFPFSAAEVLVLILPVLIMADLLRCRGRLKEALARILLIASVLFFLYAANCGVNYYREPFVDRKALSEARFTREQLAEFCGYVVSRIEECDSAAGSAEYPEGRDLAASARRSMYRLSGDEPALQGYYPVPKQLAFTSGAFSAMGVSGIYSPFTVEANINGQMPDMEKPFTACHELSHLRGFMNESEANYIGWLACIGSDDPAFRRSGWLIGWVYAGGALRRADPDQYERLREKLPESAAAELDENNEFWASHETGASGIQDRVNDAYLKANGQAEGIQSYGMLTVLMLMWYSSL